MRQQAGDRSARDRRQLALDQRADLGLGLGDREPERQRRHLVGRPLLPDELVPDLGPVPVREHELLAEQRLECGKGVAERRQVLRGGPALPGPDESVPTQGDDEGHR